MTATDTGRGRAVKLAVLVAALGYFVDIYDLLLFGIIRVPSLRDLGLDGDALRTKGVLLLDAQMVGMLLGGIGWGVLGDRRGRKSVLFGSILLYSLANLANAAVQDIWTYAVLRFIAGIGLAGELGAGITLVSELMKKETRGYGTAVVAAVGICGAIFASLVAEVAHWRWAYVIGGVMGLGLLGLRVGVMESGMFETARTQTRSRGNLLLLLRNGQRLRRYVSVILIGVPIWYAVGILVLFSPELGRALGMDPPPQAGRTVLFAYVGLAFGDLGSGVLSQVFRSRKKIAAAFLLLTALFVGLYFTVGAQSTAAFYAVVVGLGFATGYWAVFVTIASEQFGTNIRATVTTTAPNFVRGATVPLTLAFEAGSVHFGEITSAALIGAVTLVVAFVALSGLEETFGKDLDYLER